MFDRPASGKDQRLGKARPSIEEGAYTPAANHIRSSAPSHRCTSRKLQPASLDSCQPPAPKKGAEPTRDQVARCLALLAAGSWPDIMAVIVVAARRWQLSTRVPCSSSRLTYVASTAIHCIGRCAGRERNAQWQTTSTVDRPQWQIAMADLPLCFLRALAV